MSDIRRQLEHLKSAAGSADSGASTSVKEKLNRLYNRTSTGSRQKFFAEEQVVRDRKRLEELVAGEYVNTHFGDIFRARTTYDVAYEHGNTTLESFREVNPVHLEQLGNLRIPPEQPLSRALFLDTEASGLSGGTGTYAFMVGLGYFLDEQFIVDQLFVDSYVKEEGMLDLLRDYLECASALITFNGKSFDVNLLETRFLLHGQESPFENMPHLDLLHPCRNLWNLDLENCRLQTLEREILHFYREGDTPGEEIPGIYFDFLHTGDPTGMAPVFEHNVHDIVSMVGVTMMLEQNYQGVRSIPGESGLTMFSRGKMHERLGEVQTALECYHATLEVDLSPNRRGQVLSRMAGLYKKREQWTEAVGLWERQVNTPGVFRLEPYEELAKYYEHQARDYEQAIGWVAAALAELPVHRDDDQASLEYRLERLYRKAEKNR